jgi:uncharacterized protein YcgI (DUF1989 family)
MARKVVNEFVVPAGKGKGFIVEKGRVLRIVAHMGPQVASVAFLNARNHHEQFSSRWSAFLNAIEITSDPNRGTGGLKKLSKLYSKVPWENIMLIVVDDTSGVHFPGSHCSRKVDEIMKRKGRNCGDNLAECLGEFGLAPDSLDSAVLSVFLNWAINKDEAIYIKPPIAKKGDHIDFMAGMDLLVGFSNCPVPAEYNSFECKDMKVQILDGIALGGKSSH